VATIASYGEKHVNDLLNDCNRGRSRGGLHVLRFDYEVLHSYTPFDLSQLPTLDMMVDLANTLQHRLSLDSDCQTQRRRGENSRRDAGIQWFKEGKLLEIAEYCCYDVKLTKMVHEHGVNTGRCITTTVSGKADRAGEMERVSSRCTTSWTISAPRSRNFRRSAESNSPPADKIKRH